MKVLMKKFKLGSKAPQSGDQLGSLTDRAWCHLWQQMRMARYGGTADDVYTAECIGATTNFGAFIPKGPDPQPDRRLQRLHGQGLSGSDRRPPARAA